MDCLRSSTRSSQYQRSCAVYNHIILQLHDDYCTDINLNYSVANDDDFADYYHLFDVNEYKHFIDYSIDREVFGEA